MDCNLNQFLAMLAEKDIILAERPQIYTYLLNAYRKCKDIGYQPKKTFKQRTEEVDIKIKEFLSRRNTIRKNIKRNSIMMNPFEFHRQKFSAIRKRTQREQKKLKDKKYKIEDFEIKKIKVNNVKRL